jgi:4-oxalmesaconate hydratase
VPAKNILFASEMLGAVRGIDPASGHRYDDTRFLLDSLDFEAPSQREQIAATNALEVFPRLRQRLEQQGRIPSTTGAPVGATTAAH